MLADHVATADLPDNCRVQSFAAGSQVARGARYVAALSQELLERPVAVVAHMAPVSRCFAAPLQEIVPGSAAAVVHAAGRRPGARNAERVVDVVLTVDRRSVRSARRRSARSVTASTPTRSRACRSARPPLRRLLGLGRYAPVKGWETAVRSARRAPRRDTDDSRAEADGRGPRASRALDALAAELGVDRRVTFGGEVSYAQVRSCSARRRRRQPDARKRSGQGGVRSSRVVPPRLRRLAGLRHAPPGIPALPSRRRGRARRPRARLRGRGGPELRDEVIDGHSVGRWADRVLQAACEAARALRLARALPVPLEGAQKRKWDAVASVVEHRCWQLRLRRRRRRTTHFRLVPERPLPRRPALLPPLPLRIARQLRRVSAGGRARPGHPRDGGVPARARLTGARRRSSSTCRATGTRRRGCTARRCGDC